MALVVEGGPREGFWPLRSRRCAAAARCQPSTCGSCWLTDGRRPGAWSAPLTAAAHSPLSGRAGQPRRSHHPANIGCGGGGRSGAAWRPWRPRPLGFGDGGRRWVRKQVGSLRINAGFVVAAILSASIPLRRRHRFFTRTRSGVAARTPSPPPRSAFRSIIDIFIRTTAGQAITGLSLSVLAAPAAPATAVTALHHPRLRARDGDFPIHRQVPRPSKSNGLAAAIRRNINLIADPRRDSRCSFRCPCWGGVVG